MVEGEDADDAHGPAESAPPEEGPRRSGAHEDEGRAQDAQAPAREGPQTPDRVAGRLPRRERLTTSAGFQALFHRGKRIDRPSFLVLWAEPEHPRQVGFAVSRQMNRAVDRNRIRRRLREAYRAARGAAPAAVSIVLVGKKRVLEMKFERLVAELEGAFATMTASQAAAGSRS